nr:hypothetical protein HK105_003653 [Polyrhizophydium stewartii]
MIWATNYFKLASATMFTLFFAGRTFAPKCTVDGVNIQDFLQSHYINAVAALAKGIHDTPGLENDVVLGYDTLNEPGHGFIGCTDIAKLMHLQELRNGLTPTPLQAMALGSGLACQDIQVWAVGSFGPQRVGAQTVDPAGVLAWKDGVECIWARHGVWDPATGKALLPAYFASNPQTGQPFDFLADGWMPFVRRFADTIRAVHRDAVIFVEPPVNFAPPRFDPAKDPAGPICFAPHWYDGITLITKHFGSWFTVDYVGFLRGKYSNIAFALRIGEERIRSAFKSQLKLLRDEGQELVGNYPCIIGEIGLPYDMDDKQAYLTGDYSAQIRAMDFNMSALERNMLNFTLWNYCSDNNNIWGDQWNGEDLSIWSPPVAAALAKETPQKQQDSPAVQSVTSEASTAVRASVDGLASAGPTAASAAAKIDQRPIPADLDLGARALPAFVRPFPVQIPGTPISLEFDMAKRKFTFAFSHELNDAGLWDSAAGSDPQSPIPLADHTTEIFLPRVHYFDPQRSPDEHVQVWVSDGSWQVFPDLQRCVWRCSCKTTNSGTLPAHPHAMLRAQSSVPGMPDANGTAIPLKRTDSQGRSSAGRISPRVTIHHTIRIFVVSGSPSKAVDSDSEQSSENKTFAVVAAPENAGPTSVRPSDDEESMAVCPQCLVM